MRGLTAYFIKYPVAVNTVMVLIFLFGFFGLKSTRSSLFPEVESRTIQVQVIYPGASPEEVEEGVVLRIEDDVKGVTGVERISSVSQENGGIITVEVIKGYDTDVVLQDVKNAVERIPTLPDGMEPIRTFKLENIRPAVTFALSGKGVDLKALKLIARRVENPLLIKRDRFEDRNIYEVAGTVYPLVDLTNYVVKQVKLTFRIAPPAPC